MAHYEKRGDKWRAIVQRKGSPRRTRTFATKALAERWARSIEHTIDKGDSVVRPEGSLSALIKRYIEEVSDNREVGGKWERLRLSRFDNDLGHLRVDTDMVGEFIRWRDRRLKQVTSSTVRRELVVISAMFNYAKKEWRINVKNPMSEITWPAEGKPRTRRISLEEEQELLDKMGFDWDTPPTMLKTYVPWVFIFALETAMRIGEILSLTWDQVHEKWVHLSKTKNGDERDVPLSSRARRVLECMPRDGMTIFKIRPPSFDVQWRKIRPEGLHFHDTRATALSRLAPKFQPMELAKISGHRDLNMLLNTYYRPTPEELADRLD